MGISAVEINRSFLSLNQFQQWTAGHVAGHLHFHVTMVVASQLIVERRYSTAIPLIVNPNKSLGIVKPPAVRILVPICKPEIDLELLFYLKAWFYLPIVALCLHRLFISSRDVSGVELLMNNHRSLKAEVDAREENFSICLSLGRTLLNRRHPREEDVREKCIQVIRTHLS